MKILNFKNAFHQKALSKVKQFKKQEDAKDLNLEHNLLIESADREERLASQLNTLELDLNKTKQELERVYNENEIIVISHQELSNLNEQLKDNMLKQRNEIKSLKERENRLLVDNTDLDGENVQLQEQIAKLKEDLVELDTIRHENKALEEKLETLESQIVELTTLKKIVEKQLEESLNSFREEREHKYQRKRESHERREKQSLQELKNLANNLADENIHERLLYENIDIDDDEFDDQKNMGTLNEQILSRGSSTSSRNSQHEPVASSLVNEIHSDEMQTLEKKIEEIFNSAGDAHLRVNVLSFGYKYGIPVDADLVVDCRFIANPHWVPELRPLNGLDAPVSEAVLGSANTQEFLDRYQSLFETMAVGFFNEGRKYLTLAVGCTGGKHRSVAIAEELSKRFNAKSLIGGRSIIAHPMHRDLGREI